MSTNQVQPGKSVLVTAGGTVASGSVQEVGSDFIGVALGAATNGTDYQLALEGVFNVAQKTSETWAQGDKIYWDSSAATASKTYAAGAADAFIGVATAAVAANAGTGPVKLRGGAEAEVDLDDVVLKSLYDANSILAATADNTPAALTVAASTFVGRKSTGNIVALSTTEARTELNVEDGADVTDATNVAAAGAVMDTDLAYWQVTVSSGATSTTVALAAAGFVTGKPVFGSIINNTSNLTAVAKIYDDGTTLSVHVTTDPGVSAASVALWQDKR